MLGRGPALLPGSHDLGHILCQPGWVPKDRMIASMLWLQDVRTSAS